MLNTGINDMILNLCKFPFYTFKGFTYCGGDYVQVFVQIVSENLSILSYKLIIIKWQKSHHTKNKKKLKIESQAQKWINIK